jgi:hypothetical protein
MLLLLLRPSVALLLLATSASPHAGGASFPPATPPNEARGMVRLGLGAVDGHAVCGDGSEATFYWRNCTANADRAPGDKEDYCAKGGKNGVEQNIWFVVFESAGSCYDSRSCNARRAGTPALMTSVTQPRSIFPSGALSCFPEENPNYYKSTMVFVPSCSSDQFLGDAGAASSRPAFRGARILEAVFRRLARPLAAADVLVVSGEAGVMRALHSPRIAALLPRTVALRTVCDGCLLSDAQPLVPVSRQPCSTDTDCPPAVAMAHAVPFWNATARFLGADCADGGCLLTPAMLTLLAPSSGSTSLIHTDLFDYSQLRALRAWPATAAGSKAAEKYALLHAAVTRQRLLRTGSTLILAPACDGLTTASGDGRNVSVNGSMLGSFTDKTQYYSVLVAAKNSFGVEVSSSYADAVYSLATGELPALAAIDGCAAFDCNRACSDFHQCSRCGALVP